MLVLSRKKFESIMLGDDIKIVVVDIRGDKVRIGIEAPAHVQVHRQEVYNAINRNRKESDDGDYPETTTVQIDFTRGQPDSLPRASSLADYRRQRNDS